MLEVKIGDNHLQLLHSRDTRSKPFETEFYENLTVSEIYYSDFDRINN